MEGKTDLPRQDARGLTPPGQGRGCPPGAPSGCSRSAPCGPLWPWPLLGRSSLSRPLGAQSARAARRTQPHLQRLGAQLLWAPRRATEDGLCRRHIGDRHLVIARHLLALEEKESGMRSSAGRRRRRCGISEQGGLPFFIGPICSIGPTTLWRRR